MSPRGVPQREPGGLDNPDAYDPPEFKATAPPKQVGPSILETLVRDFVHELYFETPRMHTQVVPAEAVAIQVSKYDDRPDSPTYGKWQPNWDELLEVLDAGAGPPFHPMFVRYLEGRGGLAQSSISKIGEWCHAQDLQHCEMDGCTGEGGAVRTPLCERVVAALVEFGQPLNQVAWREDLSSEEVETLAIRRLKGAASWRHSELHRMMAKRRENQRDTLIICPLCLDKRIQMRRVAA